MSKAAAKPAGTLVLDCEGLAKVVHHDRELTGWLAPAQADDLRVITSAATLVEVVHPRLKRPALERTLSRIVGSGASPPGRSDRRASSRAWRVPGLSGGNGLYVHRRIRCAVDRGRAVTEPELPGLPVLDVGTLLADRLLTVANLDDAVACASHISDTGGGLVISGGRNTNGTTTTRAGLRSAGRAARGTGRSAGRGRRGGSGRSSLSVAQLRAAFPGVPVLREPLSAACHVATADDPFQLSDPGDLVPLSLAQVLDNQLAGGASAALTPTGFIAAGDAAALKAAVTAANGLDRRDTLLWLPCEWPWAREPDVTQLIAVVRRSRHPVALSLGSDGDPLEHKGVPAGLRRLVEEVPAIIPWRTDLAGLDALAHGAHATSIGLRAGLRHVTEPGKQGFSPAVDDRTPRVLLGDMLRYVRAQWMQNEWFASTEPPTCECTPCGGQPLDRFHDTAADHRAAYAHNIRQLARLHSELCGSGRDAHARMAWWHQALINARVAHERLAAQISSKVPFPPVLEYWASH